jgi:hypothetical protein
VKRVVHVYKGQGQWLQSPPGLGDFVRGTCHLFERLEGTGAELRVDLSQTEFAPLIENDPAFFQTGEPSRIAGAEEWFLATDDVGARIDRFLRSSETELYLCTNLGAWDRTKLGDRTREFVKKFYRFTAPVTEATAGFVQGNYAALSLRCGDKFYGEKGEATDPAMNRRLFGLIEKEILPRLGQSPLVVMSDCHPLKCELVRRYGFLASPYASQHGAFGNVLPVAVDLNVLKHSRCNYHINAWQSWWSGFSHYTSLVFGLPSVNFRTPLFVREEVTPAGGLRLPLDVRLREKLRRLRSLARAAVRPRGQ